MIYLRVFLSQPILHLQKRPCFRSGHNNGDPPPEGAKHGRIVLRMWGVLTNTGNSRNKIGYRRSPKSSVSKTILIKDDKKHFPNLFHHFFHRIAMLGIIEYEHCHVGNTPVHFLHRMADPRPPPVSAAAGYSAVPRSPVAFEGTTMSQGLKSPQKKTWILMDFCNKCWKLMFNYIAYYTKPHQNIPSWLASRDLQYLVMTFQPTAAWAKSSWFRRDLSPSYGLWCDDLIKGIAVSSGCVWIDFGSSHIADPL